MTPIYYDELARTDGSSTLVVAGMVGPDAGCFPRCQSLVSANTHPPVFCNPCFQRTHGGTHVRRPTLVWATIFIDDRGSQAQGEFVLVGEDVADFVAIYLYSVRFQQEEIILNNFGYLDGELDRFVAEVREGEIEGFTGDIGDRGSKVKFFTDERFNLFFNKFGWVAVDVKE